MLQKVVSGLDSWNIVLSAVVCTGLDTIITSEDYLGVRKEEPALQCRRQIYAPDTLSLKPGLGATEGVPKGSSGVWPVSHGPD